MPASSRAALITAAMSCSLRAFRVGTAHLSCGDIPTIVGMGISPQASRVGISPHPSDPLTGPSSGRSPREALDAQACAAGWPAIKWGGWGSNPRPRDYEKGFEPVREDHVWPSSQVSGLRVATDVHRNLSMCTPVAANFAASPPEIRGPARVDRQSRVASAAGRVAAPLNPLDPGLKRTGHRRMQRHQAQGAGSHSASRPKSVLMCSSHSRHPQLGLGA